MSEPVSIIDQCAQIKPGRYRLLSPIFDPYADFQGQSHWRIQRWVEDDGDGYWTTVGTGMCVATAFWDFKRKEGVVR